MAAMKIDISDVVNGAIEKIKQEGYTVQRWIPCSERMPETDSDVLLLQKNGDCVVGYLWSKSSFDTDLGFAKVENITHWMPLPEPPEKGGRR